METSKRKRKGGVQLTNNASCKIIYGEDDRTKKHHQRI